MHQPSASRPRTLLQLGAILAAFLLVVPPSFGEGDQDDSVKKDGNVEQEKKEKKDFKTCEAPDFDVVWTGYDSFKLVATADPPQTFVVSLKHTEAPEGREDPNDWKLKIGSSAPCPQDVGGAVEDSDIEFCVHATPEGTSAQVGVAARGPLLKAGGLLGFGYAPLPDDMEDVEKECPARLGLGQNSTIRVLDKHSIGFDLGFVYSLENGKSFASNPEAAFFARSQWHERFLVGIEARYSAISASDEPDAADDGGMGGDGGGEATADGGGEGMADGGDDEDPTFNPFENGDEGVLEADVFFSFAPVKKLPRLGIVLGAGFSTLPGENDFTATKSRLFGGLRLNVDGINHGRKGSDHFSNARGIAQIDYAEDKLFEAVVLRAASEDGTVPAVVSDESERIRLTGEIELPPLGNSKIRLVIRGHASLPTSGDGPADIRLSALASFDPRNWFKGVGSSGS
ncbi:MAG: hypothetical protein AAGN66_11025 [Acidobacteriota bacterium]